MRSLILFSVLCAAWVSGSRSQPLRLHVRCSICSDQFLRDQIPIADFVVDQGDADVLVYMVGNTTNSGGTRYAVYFDGKGAYADRLDTLVVHASADATLDDRRRLAVRTIQAGLVPYFVQAGYLDQLSVGTGEPRQRVAEALPATDPWKGWQFSLSLGGNADGESRVRSRSGNLAFETNRTTEAHRLSARVSGRLRRSEFETADGLVRADITQQSASAEAVFSVGDHLAWGLVTGGGSSSVSNIRGYWYAGPAFEASLFPYADFAHRKVTLTYELSLTRYRFDELSIFDLREQRMLEHSLQVRSSFQSAWGSLSASALVEHFLTDFERSMTDLYSVTVLLDTNFRLVRNLTISLGASYVLVEDQFYLPKRAASPEDILLGRIALPTSWRYYTYASLTYRFGSRYANVINPRL